MRKFNLLEKEILVKLVNSDVLKEQGLIQCLKFLEDNYVGHNFDTSIMFVKGKAIIISTKNKDPKSKMLFFITFFNLLKDLQDMRSIYIFGDNTTNDSCLGNQHNESAMKLPLDICPYAYDTLAKYILVSDDIKDLVENNFKTVEDRRHRKEIKIARGSLVITFIALLFSFISPFVFSTKIEQNQIDSIRTDLRQIDSSIDKLSFVMTSEIKTDNEIKNSTEINIAEK